MSFERAVVVSDCTDLAFAEIRGAIIGSARAAGLERDPVVEPLVPVSDFSVIAGAFAARMMAEAYDQHTIVMVVVNAIPVRTERIVGRLGNGMVFEGTNTGTFGWLIRDFGLEECYELVDPGFVPFGGKYVHAPAVGKVLAGKSLSDLGKPFLASNIRTALPSPGLVVHIDNFGNAKFALADRYQEGQQLKVILPCGTHLSAVYGRRMMDHPDGTWVVYPGSSLDLAELGEVRGLGLRRFDLRAGDVLEIASVP